MKLNEITKPFFEAGKAGLIPYVKTGEGIKMMFMVPSDPAFGGDRPTIAKGRIDKGETPEQAAVREAEEELGLKKSNMIGKPKLVWEDKLSGLDATYILHVYAVEVKSTDDFNKAHYETGSVHWLSAEEFAHHGRNSQNHIVQAVAKSIS